MGRWLRCGATVRARWLIGAALPLLLLAVALAGCVSVAGGGSQPSTPAATSALTSSPLVTSKVTPEGPGADIVPLADVYFRASTDFYGALQLMTNLGLQPVYACTGYLSAGVRWQSQDEHGGFNRPAAVPAALGMAPTENPTPLPPPTPTTQGLPTMEVAPTPLAPSDWLQRLAALPSVYAIYNGYSGCPNIAEDLTPVPGALYFLGQTAWVEYLRVSFAAGTGGYGQALATISGLGFRLADPCYEQSLPPPTWRPMGQQATFASGGALVIAITSANSTRWLAQLKAAPGVVSVQAPYTPLCAAH